MPIYGNDLMSVQYKVVKKISVKEFKKLLKIFKEAKNCFPYKSNAIFLSTIELDEAGKSLNFYDQKVALGMLMGTKYTDQLKHIFPFISKFYNDPKKSIDDFAYSTMMESLIKTANKKIPLTGKYSKYMFDICGSWTNGKVILLEKK